MSDIDKVREFVIEELLYGDGDKLTDNTSFYETGLIDSTGILEIISFLEDTFQISIEDEELIPENMESIEKIAHYLERKISHE